MKHNILYSALVALSLIGTASCSDSFNDHYEALDTSTSGTLWQSISNKQEISNFAKVLQATGYDRDLASSQVFTVFAPTNDVLTDEKTQQLIDSYYNELKLYNNDPLKRAKTSTVKEFIQNHIALYNYSVSGGMGLQKIYMQNGKYITFDSSAFAGQNFASRNEQLGNGVLFTLGGMATYVPNIFEYVKQDPDLKEVSDFLYMTKPYQLYTEKLNETLSVPGDIVDGQQTYLDSVMVTENVIFSSSALKAQLDKEDSTYYAVMPTNKVWNELVTRNEKMFKYHKLIVKKDSFEYILPRLAVLKGAQFSKTINTKLGETQNIDSIKSTLAVKYEDRYKYSENNNMIYEYRQPYAEGGIFDGTQKIECSNGMLMKANKWNFKSTNGFLTSSVMEAEADNILDPLNSKEDAGYNTATYSILSVTSDNEWYHKVSQHQAATMQPKKNSGAVLLDFVNVFSNVVYDMYVVTVPPSAVEATDTLPSRFNATVMWRDINGKEIVHPVTPDDGSKMMEYYEDQDVVDFHVADYKNMNKIHIGTFTFPTCSFNTVDPQVKLRLDTNIASYQIGKEYTKNLYIDRIMLIPREE